MSVRVLVLPRHTRQAASCRHRFIQYLPYLRDHGFECDFAPFFDEQYTAAVLVGGKPAWRFGLALLRRLITAARAKRYDLLVVHVELVPYLPHGFEHLLSRLNVPFVVDFDDAIFHVYDQHRSAAVRWLLGDKLGRLMEDAALNCAGSEYLAAYARRFSSSVAVVPTVVDLSRYPASQPVHRTDMFSIGWIGSPATTPHLQLVMNELAAFARGRRVEVVAIGAAPFDAGSVPVRFVKWSEETEVADLARTDVGIMPLPSTPFTRGKCGFKLIQAMGCWKPVVASPVGANCDIVEHGVSGFLAADGGWVAALERLYDNPALATRMGRDGRHVVERKYSLQVWAPRLASLWAKAAGRELTTPSTITHVSASCVE